MPRLSEIRGGRTIEVEGSLGFRAYQQRFQTDEGYFDRWTESSLWGVDAQLVVTEYRVFGGAPLVIFCCTLLASWSRTGNMTVNEIGNSTWEMTPFKVGRSHEHMPHFVKGR